MLTCHATIRANYSLTSYLVFINIPRLYTNVNVKQLCTKKAGAATGSCDPEPSVGRLIRRNEITVSGYDDVVVKTDAEQLAGLPDALRNLAVLLADNRANESRDRACSGMTECAMI